MQVQIFVYLRLWWLLLGCGPLLGCIGIPSGHEVGVHGGMFTQGVHAAYQGWNRAGIEVGYDQTNRSSFYNDGSARWLYSDLRYYVSTVFLVKLGAAYSSFETSEEGYENYGRSTHLDAQTLGLHGSFGNLWHLRKGIAIGCDYVSGYQPLVLLSRDIETKGGRLSASSQRKIDDRVMNPIGGVLTFYLGYDF